jgi:micrococcal nuclease
MKPYYYIAEVVKVYDGDTCTCVVDLGFKTYLRIKVRLVGVDTPEIRTKDLEEKTRGIATRDWLRERILGKKVLLHTKDKGKFGRWLGTIWELSEETPEFENSYNNKLITEGFAKKYLGGKR